MSAFDDDELREQALSGVAALITDLDPGAMVQRFVLLAEVIDSDGERALWALTPPDARAWDTLGLIEYARLIEAAAVNQ